MYHTAGAIGTGGVLGLRQTGRKLITDLRAILKSFLSNLKMEENLTGQNILSTVAWKVFRSIIIRIKI